MGAAAPAGKPAAISCYGVGRAGDPAFVLSVALSRGGRGRTLLVVEHYGESGAVDAALAPWRREAYRRIGLRVRVLHGIIERLRRRIAEGRIAGAVRLAGPERLRDALRGN